MHRGSRGLVAERGCRVRRAWGIFGSRGGGRAVCSVSVRFGAGARRPGRESRALRGAWSRTRRVQVHAGADGATDRARGPIGEQRTSWSNIGADGCLSGPPHRGPGGSARIARFERESSGRSACAGCGATPYNESVSNSKHCSLAECEHSSLYTEGTGLHVPYSVKR
jgi:hypothetical protein